MHSSVLQSLLELPYSNFLFILNIQFLLYQNISKLRDKGLSYNKIAEWLNKKNYLSARGKILKGNHVHSILKKKRLKDKMIMVKRKTNLRGVTMVEL